MATQVQAALKPGKPPKNAQVQTGNRMRMAGHVQDIHATERGSRDILEIDELSQYTFSLSSWVSQRKGKNNPGQSLKGPHQRHLNNINTMFGRQLLSTLLCLQHGKCGPEKGRDARAECGVRSQGRSQSYFYNVTHICRKRQMPLCERRQ